jgi:hypothetical protein
MDLMALFVGTLKFVVNFIFTQWSGQVVDFILGLF